MTYLYNLWINAVCTTFGCWAAAAAPTAGAMFPLGIGSYSPFVVCTFAVRSATGLLRGAGGPIVVVVALVGVMSIGSTAECIGEFDADEGRIGIVFWMLEANGSVNGLRCDSVVAAMYVLMCRVSTTRGYVGGYIGYS